MASFSEFQEVQAAAVGPDEIGAQVMLWSGNPDAGGRNDRRASAWEPVAVEERMDASSQDKAHTIYY
jgi:hypothetical protein